MNPSRRPTARGRNDPRPDGESRSGHPAATARGELVPDELWERIVVLLPPPYEGPRRPGRLRLPDRAVLNGILVVLTTGIGWAKLPAESGFGSGMTCWRRLDEWHDAGIWDLVAHALLDHFDREGPPARAAALHRALDAGAVARPEPCGFRTGAVHRRLGAGARRNG